MPTTKPNFDLGVMLAVAYMAYCYGITYDEAEKRFDGRPIGAYWGALGGQVVTQNNDVATLSEPRWN